MSLRLNPKIEIKVSTIEGKVRHDTRIVRIVATIIHNLHKIGVGPNVADTEGDLSEGTRKLVEDVLERFEGHVGTNRRVGLVAKTANDRNFGARFGMP